MPPILCPRRVETRVKKEPATVAFYAELKLDPESQELQELDELLLRLGSEDSLIESIEQSTAELGEEVDIAGAEIAFAILPSALETAAESAAPSLGELSGTESDE